MCLNALATSRACNAPRQNAAERIPPPESAKPMVSYTVPSALGSTAACAVVSTFQQGKGPTFALSARRWLMAACSLSRTASKVTVLFSTEGLPVAKFTVLAPMDEADPLESLSLSMASLSLHFSLTPTTRFAASSCDLDGTRMSNEAPGSQLV